MAFATVQLSTDGRRNLGILLTGLCLVQFLIGLVVLSCGIHFVRNLQWRILVIDNYDPYSLAMTILGVGGCMCFVHFCAAKIFYDSSKEETRHRFECLLLVIVVLFLCFLIVELSLILACKIHHDYRLQTFREGFLMALKKYPSHPEIKVHMDRLQWEDECCGADSFKDWLENDWVAPQYNPLANGKTTPSQNSVYYPWNINLPPPLKQSPPIPAPTPIVGKIPGQNFGYHNEPLETTTLDKSKLDGFSRMPRRFKRYLDTEEHQEWVAFKNSGSRTHLSIVPWSCCSADFYGPCIHDYVTQRYITLQMQAKTSWNGESLHQKGCAVQLKDTYNAYLKTCSFLFSISAIFQIIMLISARYLQTSVENVDLYNRQDNSAPGYLLTSSCFGDSSYTSITTHHKLKDKTMHRRERGDSTDNTATDTGSKSEENENENQNEINENVSSLKSEYDRLMKKKRRQSKRERKKRLINKFLSRTRNHQDEMRKEKKDQDQIDDRNWNETDDEEEQEEEKGQGHKEQEARINSEMVYVDETDSKSRNDHKYKARKARTHHLHRPKSTTKSHKHHVKVKHYRHHTRLQSDNENDQDNDVEKVGLLTGINSSRSRSRKRKSHKSRKGRGRKNRK